MNKKANRVLSMVLTVLMLISMVSVFVLPASAATYGTDEWYAEVLDSAYIVYPDYVEGETTTIFFGGMDRNLPAGQAVYSDIASAVTAAAEDAAPVFVLASGTYTDAISLPVGSILYGAYAGVSPNVALTDADKTIEKVKTTISEKGVAWQANSERLDANETYIGATVSIGENTVLTNNSGMVIDGVAFSRTTYGTTKLYSYPTADSESTLDFNVYLKNCKTIEAMTTKWLFTGSNTTNLNEKYIFENYRSEYADTQWLNSNVNGLEFKDSYISNVNTAMANSATAIKAGTNIELKFTGCILYNWADWTINLSKVASGVVANITVTLDNNVLYNWSKKTTAGLIQLKNRADGAITTLNFTNNEVYQDINVGYNIYVSASYGTHILNVTDNRLIFTNETKDSVVTGSTAVTQELADGSGENNRKYVINLNRNFFSTSINGAGEEIKFGGTGGGIQEGIDFTNTDWTWDPYDLDYYADSAMTTLVHKLVDVEGKEATCEQDGYTAHKACKNCDYVEGKETIPAGHTEGEVVVENEVAADCENNGSYDEVVYCTVCGEELSRETITVDALGHTEGEAVVENEVAADCENNGSYDEVVYCTVCGEELSRETITVDALGHTEGEAVIENKTDATCGEAGSYDEVIYCTVCGEELSRNTVTVENLPHTEVIDAAVAPTCTETGLTEGKHCEVCGEVIVAQTVVDALGHTEGEVVVENEVAADCENNGSYDNVVYCTVCGEELSRKTITVDALGHTEGEAVVENKTDATCGEAGSYDEVVYCTVCGEELSRKTVTVDKLPHTEVIDAAVAPTCTETGLTEGKHCEVCGEVIVAQTVVDALGHTEGEVVVENEVAADCENAGSYDNVVYCTVCGEELSRNTVTVDKLPHTEVIDAAVAPTCTETGLTEGSHCEVCGEVIVAQTVVEALGHNYESVVTIEPTLESEGEMTYTCTVCGDSYTEVIPALTLPVLSLNEDGNVVLTTGITVTKIYYGNIGDNVPASSAKYPWNEFVSLTADTRKTDFKPLDGDVYELTEDGNYYFAVVYTVDGVSKTEYKVFMADGSMLTVHTAVTVVENEVAADCENTGSYDKVVKCKTCGEELSRETIIVDALGHDYEVEITTEPTNDTEGLKTFTCKTCGDSFTEVLDKLGMPRIKENGKLSENGVDVIKVYYGFIGSNAPTQMNADKAWKKWDEFTALTAAGRTSDFAPVDGEKYAMTEDGNYYFAIVYKDANGAQKTTYSVVNSASVESDKPTVTVENGVATLSTNNLKVTKLYWGFMGESTATDWDTFKAEAQNFTSDFALVNAEEYTLTEQGNYCFYIIYEEECVQTAVAYSVANK